MEARAMNPKALATMAAAVALTLAAAAGTAQAENRAISRTAPAVAMRTLLAYDDGAWTSPVAIVLRSAADWTSWNHEMVERGMAIGEEPMPAGIDWNREAVMVVALGGEGSRVRLQNARRIGLRTELDAALSQDGTGEYPCHVVAMDKRLLKNVRLTNAAQCGLPAQVSIYVPGAALASTNSAAAPAPVATSWGEVKDAYRQ